MISNIFFLILFFFTITSAGDGEYTIYFLETPGKAFLIGLGLYVLLLVALYFINRRNFGKDRLLFFDNVVLLLFFLVYYFVLGSQRWIRSHEILPFPQTLAAILAVTLYFFALAVCHFAQANPRWNRKHAIKKGWHAVRFLLPFSLPFLIFIVLDDVGRMLPVEKLREVMGIEKGSDSESILSIAFSILSVIGVLALFPVLVLWSWQCPPLEEGILKDRLERLCQKAQFKHAGLKIWSVMEEAYTAAIIGLIARFRYIMFTRKLVDKIPPDYIEAILAHEMGHNKYKHLIFYPFILLGMLAFGILFADFSFHLIHNTWNLSETAWDPLFYLALFLIAIALYFRYIFGYFSRLFERQADLYVYEVGVPVDHIIGALDTVGVYSGNIHDIPSWHHFSIKERIDFLERSKINPEIVKEHHKLVRTSLWIYFFLLFIVLFFVFEV